jgi:hypothetical protein
MIKDDIKEVSESPYKNPVTVVHGEGKKPRLCIVSTKLPFHTAREPRLYTSCSKGFMEPNL